MSIAKILIVEDETPIAGALEAKLTIEGFDVVVAKNGEEGLLAAKTEEPDLILADIIMPRMNGLTMIEKIRKSENKTPILVLTNLEDQESISKSIEENCEGYLVKSNYSLDEVLALIKKTLGKDGK